MAPARGLRFAAALAGLAGPALFLCLFATMKSAQGAFWWRMAGINLGLVIASALAERGMAARLAEELRRRPLRGAAIGVLSALLLYAVFAAGDLALRLLLGGEAARALADVYGLKQWLPTWQIALLMALVIGPGEEIFWRAFMQQRLALRLGPLKGMLLATLIYGGVHLPSGNLPLILAAFVCGLFWGGLYHYGKSLWINIVSHVVWDLLVFLILPLH
jgi:uncharacterized protein